MGRKKGFGKRHVGPLTGPLKPCLGLPPSWAQGPGTGGAEDRITLLSSFKGVNALKASVGLLEPQWLHLESTTRSRKVPTSQDIDGDRP